MGRPKGSKTKNKNKENYFNEKEMTELLKVYKQTRDEKVFEKLNSGIKNIVNGMINKQFSYNSFIKNNKKDAEAECILEVYKSLKRFNVEKGRLFAYVNRIAKNTLLKYQNSARKINHFETIYADIVHSENTELSDDVFNRIISNQTGIPNTKIKKVMSVDKSLSVIYKYFIHVKNVTEYFLTNSSNLKNLVYTIKYDYNIDFNFHFEKTISFVSDETRYQLIIENIDNILTDLISWLEKEYHEEISLEPEYNNFIISPRAIGYIKKHVRKNMKKQKIFKNLSVDDLVEFINYISYQKEYVFE